MKTLNKRTVKILSVITFILGIIALIWLVYDYLLYNRLKPVTMEMGELGRLEKLSMFIWFSYIYLFFYHIFVAVTLVIQMRYIQKIQVMSLLTIAVGVVSFLGVFSDWSILGDIGKEYKMGWDISGEWTILFIIFGIHTIFTLLVTGVSAGVLAYIRKVSVEAKIPANDEIVFTVAQYVGIVCGGIGVAWVFMGLIIGQNTGFTIYHSIFSTIIILIPYGMISGYWFILRFRDRIGDWYDEKQWHDITRAGFTTLLLLIPVLLFFFALFSLSGKNYPSELLWFPFALFVILFFFSVFTMLNYHRR